MSEIHPQARTTPRTRAEIKASSASLTELCEQFDAKPAEIRELLRGTLNPQRSTDLIEEMRAAGLPL